MNEQLNTNMEFEKVSKLRKLAVEILINSVEPVLKLFFGEFADWVVCGIMINVWQKDGLGERRFDMLSGATISVPTSTDLSGKQGIFSARAIDAARNRVLCNKMSSSHDPALYQRYLPQK